jgi:small subunit ribosomal protein S3
MGQKIHPEGVRIGVIKGWKSRWLVKKNFKDLLLEDFKIRKFIKEKLYSAGISRVEIERAGNKAILKIFTAKPGMIIGRKGTEVEVLRKDLEKLTGKQILIEPKEIQKPEIEATLVAENVAQQLEKRISYRRAMKKAMQTAMAPDSGALGIKICCAGRLAGAEIARTEWYVEGRVPLQTLRADIDYGTATAFTTYGTIGVKVWIFKGEILPGDEIK